MFLSEKWAQFQQNITSAAHVQLIYDNIERYFTSRNLVKVIFGKKIPEAFHFRRCYFGMSILTRAHRKPPSKIAKSRTHESSVTAFDIAPAITPATLYPRIILHTAGYTRVLLSLRHFYPRFNARLP